MEILHLEENEIREIEPKAFHYFYTLQTLYLADNKLVKIEDGIFLQMRNLSKIHLDHNLLETVPNDFMLMNQLKTLTLTNNKIISVNWWHFRMVSIDILKLYGNPMNCTCNNYELRQWSGYGITNLYAN